MKLIKYIFSVSILCFSVFAEIDIQFNTPASKRRPKEGTPCQTMVVDSIDHLIEESKSERTRCSIKIAMYSLDDLSILKKLNEARAQGIRIELLIDKGQNAEVIEKLSDTNISRFYKALKEEKIETRKQRSVLFSHISPHIVGSPYVPGKSYNSIRILHEKMAIFSCEKLEEQEGRTAKAIIANEDNHDSDAIILGSYNWTTAASEVNYENCVLIQNEPEFIEKAKARFERIKAGEDSILSVGSSKPPIVPGRGNSSSSQNDPKTQKKSSSGSQSQNQQTSSMLKEPTEQQNQMKSPSPFKTRAQTEYGLKKTSSSTTNVETDEKS